MKAEQYTEMYVPDSFLHKSMDTGNFSGRMGNFPAQTLWQGQLYVKNADIKLSGSQKK